MNSFPRWCFIVSIDQRWIVRNEVDDQFLPPVFSFGKKSPKFMCNLTKRHSDIKHHTTPHHVTSHRITPNHRIIPPGTTCTTAHITSRHIPFPLHCITSHRYAPIVLLFFFFSLFFFSWTPSRVMSRNIFRNIPYGISSAEVVQENRRAMAGRNPAMIQSQQIVNA